MASTVQEDHLANYNSEKQHDQLAHTEVWNTTWSKSVSGKALVIDMLLPILAFSPHFCKCKDALYLSDYTTAAYNT